MPLIVKILFSHDLCSEYWQYLLLGENSRYCKEVVFVDSLRDTHLR